MKKIIDLSVEGAKVIDLCVEGDKLLEQGTGAVYNKPVKGVKVNKGAYFIPFFSFFFFFFRLAEAPVVVFVACCAISLKISF